MSDVIRVLDLSEFTEGVSPDWWRRVRDNEGARAVVIQSWGAGPTRPGVNHANTRFRRQLEGALASGLKVATYCAGPEAWEPALRHIGSAKQELAFLALDVEAGARLTRAHVGGVKTAGLRPVIYTNPSWWTSTMRNTQGFSDVPLWLARYPRDLAPSATVEWEADLSTAFGGYQVGGWTSTIGWQFRGTTDIAGRQADLNLFLASAFEQEEAEMKPYLVQEQGSAFVWITNGVIRAHLADRTHAAALGIADDIKIVPPGTLDSVAEIPKRLGDVATRILGPAS